MAHDLVIRGGTIIDGTGAPPVAGDIAVDGDTIAAVGAVPGAGGCVTRSNRITNTRSCDSRLRPLIVAPSASAVLAAASISISGGELSNPSRSIMMRARTQSPYCVKWIPLNVRRRSWRSAIRS